MIKAEIYSLNAPGKPFSYPCSREMLYIDTFFFLILLFLVLWSCILFLVSLSCSFFHHHSSIFFILSYFLLLCSLFCLSSFPFPLSVPLPFHTSIFYISVMFYWHFSIHKSYFVKGYNKSLFVACIIINQ